MGCCISKCKPKRKPHHHHLDSDVQDKLVISQSQRPPPPASPPCKLKAAPSPPSSFSASLTCSTQTSSCGSSSLSSSSSSSSVAYSKVVDRSFSNDFLQSCAKENPQIIGLDPTKQTRELAKQSVPGSTLKRARASSPTLTRQKSFRVEKERSPANTAVNGRNTMRSPSPSRRFNGPASNYQRPPMLFSMNAHSESINNRLAKPNVRPASPKRNLMSSERPMFVKNKERFGYEVGSEGDSTVEVGQVLAKVDYSGPVPMEDIDNPHIALDCFIFL